MAAAIDGKTAAKPSNVEELLGGLAPIEGARVEATAQDPAEGHSRL